MAIFISVPSYKDPLLTETLCSAYQNAKFKKNLRFCVLDQSEHGIEIDKLVFKDQIIYENVPPVISKGVCWARSRIQEYFEDEEYYLQIDSHTIFQENWDEILITYHDWLKAQNNNFVISSYPRAFTCNKTLTEFELDTKFQGTHGMSFKKGDVFKYDIVSIQTAIPTSSSEPLKGHLVAAGFLFSSGNFVKEIPYDPEYYFHGEELAIAVKLFTRGWDVFHIPKTPLFHLYTDVENLPRDLHWNPKDEENRIKKWTELDAISKKKIESLFNGEVDGKFGLGDKRTIKDFGTVLGLDFEKKEIVSPDLAFTESRFLKVINESVPFASVLADNK